MKKGLVVLNTMVMLTSAFMPATSALEVKVLEEKNIATLEEAETKKSELEQEMRNNGYNVTRSDVYNGTVYFDVKPIRDEEKTETVGRYASEEEANEVAESYNNVIDNMVDGVGYYQTVEAKVEKVEEEKTFETETFDNEGKLYPFSEISKAIIAKQNELGEGAKVKARSQYVEKKNTKVNETTETQEELTIEQVNALIEQYGEENVKVTETEPDRIEETFSFVEVADRDNALKNRIEELEELGYVVEYETFTNTRPSTNNNNKDNNHDSIETNKTTWKIEERGGNFELYGTYEDMDAELTMELAKSIVAENAPQFEVEHFSQQDQKNMWVIQVRFKENAYSISATRKKYSAIITHKETIEEIIKGYKYSLFGTYKETKYEVSYTSKILETERVEVKTYNTVVEGSKEDYSEMNPKTYDATTTYAALSFASIVGMITSALSLKKKKTTK